jgi:4-alpha-glucanotransferase
MAVNETRFEAAVNYDDALWRAAAESDVQSSYWDIFGGQHHASRETLQAILRSLGWDVGTYEIIESQRRSQFLEQVQYIVPITCVVSESDKWVPVAFPSHVEMPISYQILLEDNNMLEGFAHTSQLQPVSTATLDRDHWTQYRLELPAEVPLGYHSLIISIEEQSVRPANLIICPDRAYLPDALAAGGRTAGFNVALYGLRSARNWGCGDFTDLRALTSWAFREIGFSFIGVNPLHALHNRAPYNTSPYLPLSMSYKNHIYIDIEAVPEFAGSSCARALFDSPGVQRQIQELRESEFVQYSDVARLKRRFLKALYRGFRRLGDQNERQRAFQVYCQQEGELLKRFALYCALDEALHKRDRTLWTWRDWPTHYQTPDSAESQAFAREHGRSIEFYQYVQFVIEEQLTQAQQHARDCGMSIGLYHDLAVATDNCGCDLWSSRDHYMEGCRVGAPPDDFSPQGQDWGFPPPNKNVHRAEGYQLYRESIRKIVRHGGALRIDHVMRLFRLFWIPLGMTPPAGAYVRDYAEDLMHVLALESVRSRNIIVGEDLGTVTDEMRELFTRFGILSYRLFPFERNYQTGEFKRSFDYPRQALVSSTTHDLPTLAGFWRNADLDARLHAGLIDQATYQNQLLVRRSDKQRMLDRLHAENLLPAYYTRDASNLNDLDGDLHNAIVGFLSRVPSMILLLNQEDFTKESDQQNLPGSTSQYPNWQRKMQIQIEELSYSSSNDYSKMFKHQLDRAARV